MKMEHLLKQTDEKSDVENELVRLMTVTLRLERELSELDEE
jgi:hypothetical protein